MAKFGFCGATFVGQSLSADSEDIVDLYPEPMSGPGITPKSPMALYSRPGLKFVGGLPGANGPVRAMFSQNGVVYGVIGNQILQFTQNMDGTLAFSLSASIATSTGPVSISSNSQQLLILDGTGTGYVLGIPGTGGTQAIPITSSGWPSGTYGVFIDDYFVVMQSNSRKFFLSNLLDGTMWDPLFFATKEGNSDNIVSLLAAHDDLWIFGNQTTEIWSNTGAANFPFQRVPGLIINEGCAAQFSPVNVSDNVFWLSQSVRGKGIVWKASGFQPTRISNYSIEYLISQMSRIDDAIGYSYTENGHVFYILYFPTANQTLAYDDTTGMWHKRGFWNTQTGQYDAHLGQCYAFAFGLDLIGSRNSPTIYNQTSNYYQDDVSPNGISSAVTQNPIRRLRSSPHVSDELKVYNHDLLQIDMQVGVGLSGTPPTPGVNPQIMMQMSNDGGFTWGNERWLSIGSQGQYKTRIKFWRLGKSKDRCYRVVVSDPIPVAFVDAYLRVRPGDGAV